MSRAPEDYRAEFEAAMAAGGLEIPHGGVVADGKIHRCDVEGKNGKGDGAYCLHLDDGIPAGWFHRDGAGVRRWHARTGQKLTPAEVAAHKAKVRAQQARREAELEKEHVRTAARATALVENNPDADDSHPYFVRKKSQGAARYQAFGDTGRDLAMAEFRPRCRYRSGLRYRRHPLERAGHRRSWPQRLSQG